MDGYSLNGKIALVTGVGQNIGLATAGVLAAAGASLALNDLRLAAAERAIETLPSGTPAFAVEADIRDRAAVQRMVDSVVERFGGIDILVNNAGESSFASVVEMEEAAWDREVDTNLKGTFLVSQAVARVLIRQGRGGRIICLASSAAESARVGGASHCASKAGVAMLTKVMALELGEHGITVNAVAPGLVPGPEQSSSQEYRQAFLQMLPMRRLGQPIDIAYAIGFLASDQASWITGEVFHVDGGFLAGRALPPSLRR